MEKLQKGQKRAQEALTEKALKGKEESLKVEKAKERKNHQINLDSLLDKLEKATKRRESKFKVKI